MSLQIIKNGQEGRGGKECGERKEETSREGRGKKATGK